MMLGAPSSVYAGEAVESWPLNEGQGYTITSAGQSPGCAWLGTKPSENTHAPKWTKIGQDNFALEFDGVDDFIVLGKSPRYDLSNPDGLTLEVWFKSSAWSQGDRAKPLLQRYDWGQGRGYLLGIRGNHDFGFTIFNGPHDPKRIEAVVIADDISLNEWHQAVGVYDPREKNICFYLDGQLEAKKHVYLGEVWPALPDTGDLPLVIGHMGWAIIGDWSYAAFKGILGKVKIYNYARSSEEIGKSFQEGAVAPGICFGKINMLGESGQ